MPEIQQVLLEQNTQERCNEFSKDNKEVSTEVSISLSKLS